MAGAKYKGGVLTLSDKGAAGGRDDLSGRAIKEILSGVGISIERYEVIPDDIETIKETLIYWSDEDCLDIIVTTGGTGFAPRDVTPEATAAVVDRPTPGISEAMRLAGLKNTPKAILSRGTSGIRGATLIINVPGSEKGARESLEAILPALDHGLEVLTGVGGECGG